MSDYISVLVCGVKGQGVSTTSKIIAYAATLSGCDVKMLPFGGNKAGTSCGVMIKYGSNIFSSQISKGEADVVLSLEKLETARNIELLKIGGKIISSSEKIPLENKKVNYPDDVFDNLAMLGVDVIVIDTAMVCKLSENAKNTGVALLGSAYEYLGFTKDIIRDSIRKVLDNNEAESAINAFDIAVGMGTLGKDNG